MKKFVFNHNDYITVTLTKEGARRLHRWCRLAEHLSNLRKEFYNAYPQLPRRKEVFAEGEIYKAQFWSLINDFHEMMHLGMVSPFEMGKIEVDSSYEN